MFRSRFVYLVVSLCIFSTIGFTQELYSTLKPTLEGGVVELRTPAPEVQLTYDATGTLKHPSKHGLRSIDGLLVIKKVKVEKDVLSLEGERLAVIWDEKAQQTEISHTSMPVYLAIDLPNGATTTEAEFVPIYYKIFYRKDDSERHGCSIEEQTFFAEVASESGTRKKRPPSDKGNVPTLCFPGGNRFARYSKGITPPKPIHTPDPHYTDVARAIQTRGTNVFLVAIDEKGLIADAVMVRSLEPSLNFQSLQALREWTFEPAKQGEKSVAFTVSVEINFTMY